MTNIQNNRRIDWIDLSKFIGITIMCLGHIGLPKQLSALIHIFHMPVFFIISGMCYSEVKYANFGVFLKQKVRTLLIPSYFWCFVMYFVWRLYCVFEMRGEPVELDEFIILAFTKDAATSMFGNLGVIQWFFTSLFFAELFFWCFITLKNKFCKKDSCLYYILFIAFLLVVNSWYIKYISINPLGIGTSIVATVFIAIGHMSKSIIRKYNELKLKKNIVFTVIAFLLVLFVWGMNGTTNMRTLQYNNIFLYLIGGCAGSFLIFQVARFIEQKMNKLKLLYNFMIYIGRNTLIVLIFNRLVQFTIIRLINYFIKNIPFNWESTIGLVILVMIDLVIEMLAFIPIIYLVNRYMFFSVGRKKVLNKNTIKENG